MAFNHPVVVAVGVGDPHGNTNTCQAEGELPSGLGNCVQPNNAVDCVIEVAVSVLGLVQVGGYAQVTFETQPAATPELSDVKTKVKHPEAVEAVNGPGTAVPEKVPKRVPAVLFPS